MSKELAIEFAEIVHKLGGPKVIPGMKDGEPAVYFDAYAGYILVEEDSSEVISDGLFDMTKEEETGLLRAGLYWSGDASVKLERRGRPKKEETVTRTTVGLYQSDIDILNGAVERREFDNVSHMVRSLIRDYEENR